MLFIFFVPLSHLPSTLTPFLFLSFFCYENEKKKNQNQKTTTAGFTRLFPALGIKRNFFLSEM